ADEILNGPMAPGPALASLMRRLMRKADAGAAVFQPIVEALDATLISLDTTSDALEALKRDMAFDPADLERVEERLFALRAMARKHHTTVDGLIEVQLRYQADLDRLSSGEETLKELEARSAAARGAYTKAAEKLSAAREKAAAQLSKAVGKELPDLKL